MKKIFIASLLACLIIACEGPVGPPGPPGEGTNWRNDTYEILAGDWTLVGDPNLPGGSYYEYVFSNSYISTFVLEYGAVAGYIVFADGKQSLLPYIETVGYTDNVGNPYLDQIQYTCDVWPGYIRFIATWMDYYNAMPLPPESVKFRIAMMW